MALHTRAVAQAAAAGTLSSAIQLIASAVAQASAPASLTAGSSGLAAMAGIGTRKRGGRLSA